MNTEITIKGNGHWRELIDGYDLTEVELAEFDYMDNPLDDFRGFRYKGDVYSLDQVMRYNKTINGKLYHGIYNFGFFSGLLINLDNGGDAVQVYYY